MTLAERLNMSNQRPGKFQSRPEMGMTQEMGTLKFFKLAQKFWKKKVKWTRHLTLNKWAIGYNLEKGCQIQRKML